MTSRMRMRLVRPAPAQIAATPTPVLPSVHREHAAAASRSFDFSKVSVSPPDHDAPSTVREAAEMGTHGTGGPLPYRDVIQRAFGWHDISRVQAYSGELPARAAQRMGATAFTHGDRIAFGAPPSLFTAAHEAAHVVQHRGGGDRVGRDGDREELQADAVAELVVRGRSTAHFLDGYLAAAPAARGAAGTAIHRKKVPKETRYSDALAGKDWRAVAAVLDEFEDNDLDKRLGKLSVDDRHSVLDAARATKHARVARHAKVAIWDKPFKKAVASDNWSVAAKALNQLEYPDVVERVDALSADELSKLKAAAGKKLATVRRAIGNLKEIRALRTQQAKLESTTGDKSASFEDVAIAFAKLKDVSHDLAVLETGSGIYQGSKADPKDPDAEITDCTIIVLDVLKNTFEQQGRVADWTKVRKKMRANQKSRGKQVGLSGLDLQAALQSELGWKGIFWAPDPAYQIPDEELIGKGIHPPEAGSTYAAAKKGTYYKDNPHEGYPGVSIDQTVVNYRPETPNAGKQSKTKQDTTGLAKLKKLPFGVLSAHGGEHMTLITYGKVIEVHWDEPSTSVDVIERTDFEDWAIGPKSGYHYFASGAIVAPAEDVKKAFK